MKKIRPMVRRVNTANDSKMNILVHDMEISLAQPNLSLIKLVFSAKQMVLVLFI